MKLAAALFGAIASAVVAMGISGGTITTAEWVNIGIAVVGAFQVWYVTETSDNPNGKAVIAAVAAGLVALHSFLTGGGHVSLVEWMQVGMAALTATGIWAAPSLAQKPVGNVTFSNVNPPTVTTLVTSGPATGTIDTGKVQAITQNIQPEAPGEAKT